MAPKPMDPNVRFDRHVHRGDVPAYRPELGPCLLYTGADNGRGYGQFRHDGRHGYAHRYAWERVHGPIPEGMTVDHLCRVRRCVDPKHLELVDAVTNFRRGKAAQTHCRNGHPYTPSNTYHWNGRRYCRTCKANNWRKASA